MADKTVTPQSATGNQTPDVSAAAPAPAAVAPAATAPATVAAAPTTSAPVAAAQPDPAAAAQAAAAPFETAAAQAAANIKQLNAQSTAPPPPGPHARLLSMVQGMAVGLGSFGKAIATHGKEGGVEDVLAYQNQKKQQDIQAQQLRDAEKNQKIQQQVTMLDTNQKLALNAWMMARQPAELNNELLGIQRNQVGLVGETQDVRQKAQQTYLQTGNSADLPDSVLPRTAAPAASAAPAAGGSTTAAGGAPVAGGGSVPVTPAASTSPAIAAAQTSGIPQWAMAGWNNKVDEAGEALPDDALIQGYRNIVNNPNTTGQQKAIAATAATNRMTALTGGADARAKLNAADPLFKLENDPSEMMGDKAPAAVALLSSKLNDPNLPATEKPRVQRLLAMAKKAQQNELDFDAAKERSKQLITDGDPKAAGALLESGLVSPQELISSRKPQFAQEAFDEAIRLGGGTKGADGKWTGGTWSAVKAEAQYEYAKNPKTQNTLNLLSTMQQPGGSIDIAQKIFNTIPGKVDEKTFNGLLNGTVTEFGGASTVAFNAALTSLADEYAQVLQGGAATETTLKQAKDLIRAAYSKYQGAAAFDTIRLDMAARQKGLVRDNPALMTMYPEPKASTSAVKPSGQDMSLKTAMALPINKGKTEDQVRADIEAHGHRVTP